MGFVLTILYLVTNYLTPVTLFGPLAEYRIELILAALILLVSLPKLPGSFIFKTPQSLALIGLALATMLSVLIGGALGRGRGKGVPGLHSECIRILPGVPALQFEEEAAGCWSRCCCSSACL